MEFLLVATAIAFCPLSVAAPYTQAVETARSAAFIQSGYRAEYDQVKGNVEKLIPPAVSQSAAVASILYKRELSWKGTLLDGTVNKSGGSLLLHVSF